MDNEGLEYALEKKRQISFVINAERLIEAGFTLVRMAPRTAGAGGHILCPESIPCDYVCHAYDRMNKNDSGEPFYDPAEHNPDDSFYDPVDTAGSSSPRWYAAPAPAAAAPAAGGPPPVEKRRAQRDPGGAPGAAAACRGRLGGPPPRRKAPEAAPPRSFLDPDGIEEPVPPWWRQGPEAWIRHRAAAAAAPAAHGWRTRAKSAGALGGNGSAEPSPVGSASRVPKPPKLPPPQPNLSKLPPPPKLEPAPAPWSRKRKAPPAPPPAAVRQPAELPDAVRRAVDELGVKLAGWLTPDVELAGAEVTALVVKAIFANLAFLEWLGFTGDEAEEPETKRRRLSGAQPESTSSSSSSSRAGPPERSRGLSAAQIAEIRQKARALLLNKGRS